MITVLMMCYLFSMITVNDVLPFFNDHCLNDVLPFFNDYCVNNVLPFFNDYCVNDVLPMPRWVLMLVYLAVPVKFLFSLQQRPAGFSFNLHINFCF